MIEHVPGGGFNMAVGISAKGKEYILRIPREASEHEQFRSQTKLFQFAKQSFWFAPDISLSGFEITLGPWMLFKRMPGQNLSLVYSYLSSNQACIIAREVA